jgi:hypothetical protein
LLERCAFKLTIGAPAESFLGCVDFGMRTTPTRTFESKAAKRTARQGEQTVFSRANFCAVLCQFCAVEFPPTIGNREGTVRNSLEKLGFLLHGLERPCKECERPLARPITLIL